MLALGSSCVHGPGIRRRGRTRRCSLAAALPLLALGTAQNNLAFVPGGHIDRAYNPRNGFSRQLRQLRQLIFWKNMRIFVQKMRITPTRLDKKEVTGII